MKQIKDLPELVLPSNTDKLVVQDTENVTKFISRANFLSGLTTGGNSNSQSFELITGDYTVATQNRFLVIPSSDLTVTLPINPLELQQFDFLAINPSNFLILVGIASKKYKNITQEDPVLILQTYDVITPLIFVNESYGYHGGSGFSRKQDLATGYKLWLQDGSLTDLSGYNNHATNTRTRVVTGTSGKSGFKWDGNNNQELDVTPFLSGTTGATVYVVYQADTNANYNLIQTAGLDDYWYFNGSGTGYLGVFTNSRIEQYPLAIPGNGLHLYSVHANTSQYRATFDGISRPIQTGKTYLSGDRFKVGAIGKGFNGIVYSVVCYPYFIDPVGTEHLANLKYFKRTYPLLPYA